MGGRVGGDDDNAGAAEGAPGFGAEAGAAEADDARAVGADGEEGDVAPRVPPGFRVVVEGGRRAAGGQADVNDAARAAGSVWGAGVRDERERVDRRVGEVVVVGHALVPGGFLRATEEGGGEHKPGCTTMEHRL